MLACSLERLDNSQYKITKNLKNDEKQSRLTDACDLNQVLCRQMTKAGSQIVERGRGNPETRADPESRCPRPSPHRVSISTTTKQPPYQRAPFCARFLSSVVGTGASDLISRRMKRMRRWKHRTGVSLHCPSSGGVDVAAAAAVDGDQAGPWARRGEGPY